jgi:hypothetical protein
MPSEATVHRVAPAVPGGLIHHSHLAKRVGTCNSRIVVGINTYNSIIISNNVKHCLLDLCGLSNDSDYCSERNYTTTSQARIISDLVMGQSFRSIMTLGEPSEPGGH